MSGLRPVRLAISRHRVDQENRMITTEKFKFIKEKYGLHASWAVWAHAGDRPKSNMGDLSIFGKPNIELELNSEIVLVALNFSVSGVVIRPFQNFHGTGGGAYKIRYALQDTPFWGAYMTDIIKDFPEKESGKMMSYLRKNRSFEEENANRFRKELQDLGSTISTLVAFGNDVFSILNRNFMGEFNVLKVPHYSAYTNKETYREQVQEAMAKFA